MTRIAATFVRSFLNGESWWIWFFHSTRDGVKMMTSFWGAVDEQTRKHADFKGRKNVQGFEKPNPHSRKEICTIVRVLTMNMLTCNQNLWAELHG